MATTITIAEYSYERLPYMIEIVFYLLNFFYERLAVDLALIYLVLLKVHMLCTLHAPADWYNNRKGKDIRKTS